MSTVPPFHSPVDPPSPEDAEIGGCSGLPDSPQLEMDQASGLRAAMAAQRLADDELEAEQLRHAPAPTTKRCRCWTRDGNMTAVVIVDGRKIEARWCYTSKVTLPLYQRICDANNDAWKGSATTPATGKAFIELTPAEISTLEGIAAKDLPAPKPITRRVQMPNPAAWGKRTA